MNFPINHGILLQKAKYLVQKMGEQLIAIDRWLTRWKDRHEIVNKKLKGEKYMTLMLVLQNTRQE